MKRKLALACALTIMTGCVPNVCTAKNDNEDKNMITNGHLQMQIGEYGQIESLKITDDVNEDFKNTEYVLNAGNAPKLFENGEHNQMGELFFVLKRGGETREVKTAELDGKIVKENGKITVEYDEANFKITQTYSVAGESIRWESEVENKSAEKLEIEDWGMPMAFNQYWTANYVGEELYDTRCVYHSFVGKNSSYIYALRPSGQGKLLVLTPVAQTGAGFEYRDHWRENNGHKNSAWAQDNGGYHSGLEVFYIHSASIQKTGAGYTESTSLVLDGGESKKYAFEFTAADDEADLKRVLYEKGIADAVAVPSMAFSTDMPAKFYLHANDAVTIENVYGKCVHETKLYSTQENMVNNNCECGGSPNVSFEKKVVYKGENYYVYNIRLNCLGANHIFVKYSQNGIKMETMLQFYAMEPLGDAIDLRSAFLTRHQTDTPGEVGDKTFDDWMMDDKKNRAETVDGYWQMSYWGYGDDWGYTHGEFLAQKNIYMPRKEEVKAVDEYLDTAIWNTLMREHHEDYLVHNFLSEEVNLSPTYRGYAYPHIYNTYYAMYRIEAMYPNLIEYKEDRVTYLLRAYNILKALYSDKVAYNWATGLMGEITTPDIIKSLYFEGLDEEAREVERIMSIKYDNFKNTKYPYGSEYSYDNTGEEAVYTLAKMNDAKTMMYKIDLKTRACRGVQPVWYYYANPVTICGENRWNFQYTAALAGYCMDDYLRNEDTDMSDEERSCAQRMNYGGKLAGFTCINSGQIDSDEENIGTVSWTYQSELGHNGGQGTGGGKLHNGWRQMAGEADLGLFGALEIISADVARDPVFGLFGYGCEVSEYKGKYTVVPRDGLCTRLNFINERIGVEMLGAKYEKAVVSRDKSCIELALKDDDALTEIRVSGLEKGRLYALYLNGRIKATSLGEDGYFAFKGEGDGTAVIRKAPHARKIEPYTLEKSTVQKEKRAKLEGTNVIDFEKHGEVRLVGKPKVENGMLTSETVADYVKLSNVFTNGVENFVAQIDIEFEEEQNENVRILEFSDMKGKNVSAVFGKDNELGLNIDGKIVSSGVCLPKKYKGTIVLQAKDDFLYLLADGEEILKYESDTKLKDLDEIQRNYIGRGSDETTGAFRGVLGNFIFALDETEVKRDNKDRLALEICEEIVCDGISPLPKYVTMLYSDGFKRKVEVTWHEEADGYAAVADGVEIWAKKREVDTTTNKARNAKVKVSYCAEWESEEALNDGLYTLETSNPPSEEIPRFGTWTRNESEEWIEYLWDEETELCAVGLVFLDDGGGTRAPESYSVEYYDENGTRQSVEKPFGGKSELCKMNVTSFEKVKTKAIRIVLKKGSAAGVGLLEAECY